jgi:hypothetical protein
MEKAEIFSFPTVYHKGLGVADIVFLSKYHMHRRKRVEVVFSLNFKVQNTVHPGPRVRNPKPIPTWKLR